MHSIVAVHFMPWRTSDHPILIVDDVQPFTHISLPAMGIE
jgi:hypothetical protein